MRLCEWRFVDDCGCVAVVRLTTTCLDISCELGLLTSLSWGGLSRFEMRRFELTVLASVGHYSAYASTLVACASSLSLPHFPLPHHTHTRIHTHLVWLAAEVRRTATQSDWTRHPEEKPNDGSVHESPPRELLAETLTSADLLTHRSHHRLVLTTHPIRASLQSKVALFLRSASRLVVA